jgi:hypothetical protein
MRCIDASTYNPQRPWASIDIAEPGYEHVASPAAGARILVFKNPAEYCPQVCPELGG